MHFKHVQGAQVVAFTKNACALFDATSEPETSVGVTPTTLSHFQIYNAFEKLF